MNRLKVAVSSTYLDAGASAARALQRTGHEVVGIDSGRLILGLHTRFCLRQYSISATDALGYQQELLDIIESEKPDVFLPLGTQFTGAALAIRERLERSTRMNIPPVEAYQRAYRKDVCVSECARHGVPHPRVYSLEAAVKYLSSGRGRQLVVKPSVDVGGAQGVSYVSETRTLHAAFHRCLTKFGGALIQDYVPGDASHMRTALLLFDAQSRLAAAFTTRKRRQWPHTGGITALGESTHDAVVVDQLVPMLESWGWRGAAEIELKQDPRDGRCKVIEINPRFPAYLRLAYHCGLNLPALAVDLAMGASAPAGGPLLGQAGRFFCSPTVYARAVCSDLARHGLTVGRIHAVARELRLAGPLLLEQFSDPAPLLGRAITDALALRPRVEHSKVEVETAASEIAA